MVHSSWFMVHSFHLKNIKLLIRIAIFLLFITTYHLPLTTYQCFAQEKIVAVVNNEVITQKDVDDFLNFARMQLSSQIKEDKEVEKKIEAMRQDILNRLIEDRLILQEAKRYDIKIDQERINGRLREMKDRYGSNWRFQELLRRQGITEADLEKRIREQYLMLAIVDDKIKSNISVNPSEVTEFYENNSADFKAPEEREVELVSIKEEKEAKRFFSQLNKGYNFQELAVKYHVLVNKIIVSEAGQLNKYIEAVILRLKPGQYSPPIKFQGNYYIFRLIKIIPPRQMSLNEVQDRVYTFLYNKKMQEKMSAWLDELKKKTYIKIF